MNHGGEERPTYNKKANWIGHILRRNCLQKHIFLRKDKNKNTLREDEEENISSY
jgi:hypothetical protein